MNIPVQPALTSLTAALQDWHAQARKGDVGSDPAINDPAPYALVRIAADSDARPGAVLAEIVLTERHAQDLASCLTSPTAFASCNPAALASWLASGWYARPETALCWFVACDADGTPEGCVPLDEAGAYGVAEQLGVHAIWLACEQACRKNLAIGESAHVRIVGTGSHLDSARGELGTVVRAKLVEVEPEIWWAYDVRLDRAPDGFPQTFVDGEIELCKGGPLA